MITALIGHIAGTVVYVDTGYLAGALSWSVLGAIPGYVIGRTTNMIWTRRMHDDA